MKTGPVHTIRSSSWPPSNAKQPANYRATRAMSYGHVNPRAISDLHCRLVPVAQGGWITHGQGSSAPASLSLSCIQPMQPSTSMPALPSNNNEWDDPSLGKIDFSKIDFSKIDWGKINWGNIGQNNIDQNNIGQNNIGQNNIGYNNVSHNNVNYNNVKYNNVNYNNVNYNNVNHNSVDHNNFDFSDIDLNNIDLDKIDLGNADWDSIAPDTTAPDTIAPDSIASDTIAPDNVTGGRSRHDSLTIDPAWLHGPMADVFVFHHGANLPAEQQQAVPASPERPAKRRRLNSAGDAAHTDPASSAEAEPDVEAPGSPSSVEGSAQDSETDELDVDFWFA